MKRYKITSILFAKSMKDAFKSTDKAEIVQVQLDEELEEVNKNKIGF